MSAVDPVDVEVVGNYLVSAVREMGTTLMRTAYSTIMRESMDCTTALFDPTGQLIAQADHVPSHQGTLSRAAKVVAGSIQLEPGDAVILNHPYLGGTHHPDLMIFKPVFHDGTQVALAGSLGHHIDVGGRSPGSISTDARDVFEEGLMVPPMKLYRRGELAQDILTLIEHNVRVPRKTLGDLRAQMAAVNVGERRYRELADRYGAAELARIVEACLDHSEALMRRDLRRLPDGVYRASGRLDGDGISDEPIRVEVAVTLQDGSVTVDFAGSSQQVQGPFNCATTSVYAAVYCAVRYVVDPRIRQNEGCYRPIAIAMPRGTIVNPISPAPLSGRFHTIERIANTIVMAFNQPRGDDAVASNHAHLPSFSVTDGRFVCFEMLGGGWGGTAAGDGLDAAFGLMANCFDTPIEALEMEYPLRVERYELRRDSGGPGRWRGGLGVRRDTRYLGGDGLFTNRSDGTRFAPEGALGGGDGLPAAQRFVRADGTAEPLASKDTNRSIHPGDLIVFETAGGGGWGDPRERDPERVRRDVAEGKVSPEQARDVYGVDAEEGTASRRPARKAHDLDVEGRTIARRPVREADGVDVEGQR